LNLIFQKNTLHIFDVQILILKRAITVEKQ
jgi:hypothetical protein